MSTNRKTEAVVWTRKNVLNEYPIKIRYYSGGKYKYLPCNISISNIKFWNEKEHRVRSTHPHHINFNRKIDEKIASLAKNINTVSSNGLLSTYIIMHSTHLESDGHIGNAKKFRVLANKLIEFNPDTRINQIELNFLERFKSFLKRQKLNDNTIQIYLNKFKRIYKLLKIQKFIAQNENAFEFFEYGGKATVSKAMSLQDFQEFFTADWTVNNKDYNAKLYPKYEMIQNMMFFAFLCQGLRFGDLVNMKWSNIQGEHFTYKMIKTKKEMAVYINGTLLDFFYEVYLDIENKPIVEKLNRDQKIKVINQTAIDREDKYIIDFLEGHDNTEKEKYNRIQAVNAYVNKLLKDMCKTIKIRGISTHTIRHTYASFLIEKESIQLVSSTLGHSSLVITNKYIKTLKQDTVDSSINGFYDGLLGKKAEVSSEPNDYESP